LLDAAGKAGPGKRPEHVVNGLGGDGVELGTRLPSDLLDLEVAALAQDFQHGEAWLGHPKAVRTQKTLA